jgi:hypothetical protein
MAANAVGADYHVTPTGSDQGDGSINDPWDISTALYHKQNTVQPGDTIFLHEGTYTERTDCRLTGSAAGHITITNYQDDVVILDGAEDDNLPNHPAVLNCDHNWCQYIIIEGLIITNSNPERWTDTPGSFAPAPQNWPGITLYAPNCIIRNNIIHNNHANGIFCGKEATDAQIYGNIIYHNGWEAPDRAHCYAMYVQNENPDSHVQIHNNIIFSNFHYGIHLFLSSGDVLRNIRIFDNVVFESGAPSSVGPKANNIYIGPNKRLENIEVTNNHTYLSHSTEGGSIKIGRYEDDNLNVVATGNYTTSGDRPFAVNYWENVTVENNFIYSKHGGIVEISENGVDFSTYTWNHNKYFYSGSMTNCMDGYNWSDWRSIYGFDTSSSAEILSAPSQNEYFLNLCHGCNWASLVIYDWLGLNAVNVDLSSIISNGVDYYIYDVQNLSSPLVSGTYNGSTVRVPTNLTTVMPVYGNNIANKYPPHTPQEFNVYIIKTSMPLSIPFSSTWAALIGMP